MAIRLTNRFNPDAHKKTDTLKKLKEEPYNKIFKEEILPKTSAMFPLLGLANYTLLLGYVENGDFKEWIDKRSLATISADVLRPEAALIDLILKAVNMFPNPDVLMDRLIDRLIDIKTNKSSILKKE